MKQKLFSVEQIVALLKQAKAGIPLADLLRRVGVSEQTFYQKQRTLHERFRYNRGPQQNRATGESETHNHSLSDRLNNSHKR